ncbi:MAG: hypothetical protein HYY62_04665 [Deltaproteobacteria bacterium]|nr:hypothetical protein [Deltaproteobacteria bacterium]
MNKKKKEEIELDSYIEDLRNDPNKSDSEKLLLKISDEFDRGDFSSLDPKFPSPSFIKSMKRDEQRLKEWEAKKKREETKKSPSKKRRSEKTASV